MKRDGDDHNEMLPDDVPHDGDLRALYRQLPPEEPRAEIDASLRAAARRAVGARPTGDVMHPQHELRWWSLPRWRVPVAVAATMLVTLVIVREEPVQNMVLQEAARRDMAQQEIAPPAAPAGSAADAVTVTSEPVPVVAQSMQHSARPALAAPPTAAVVAEAASTGLAIADVAAADGELPQQAQATVSASAPAPAPAPAERKREAVVTTGALAAMQEMRVAKQAAAPPQAQEIDMPAASAAHDWPFGLSPAMSLNEVCARLAAAGTAVAATCGGESATPRQLQARDAAVFVVTVRDSEAFLRDIDARLRAGGWSLVTGDTAVATEGAGYRYARAADALRGDVSRGDASPDIFAVTVIAAGRVSISLLPAAR